MLLTTRGMYNYYPQLFDKLKVPKKVDKSLLIERILIATDELEVLYSEPLRFTNNIGTWSNIHCSSWELMASALDCVYNPIENYDRTEETTTEGTSQTEGTTEGDNVQKETAFDSGELAETNSTGSKTVGTGKTRNDNTTKSRIHGNIGVTTNQQMIQAEIELRKSNNLYDIIADNFVLNFCIMRY